MVNIKRHLPKKGNPLLPTSKAPSFDELVERRRLGHTKLEVKKGQVGTINATLPSNLGIFEYAHLRAPLPEDLTSQSSGVFRDPIPDSYFLMRRSKDGYISATGMFKAAYPWASADEEDTERRYIQGLSTTSTDETAGNIWIPETFALDLAEEYNIGIWIKALLDPSPIDSKAVTGSKQSISPPPKFALPKAHALLPPENLQGTPGRGRGRPRSDSPSKNTSPGKKGTPGRKPRGTSKAANVANANAASETLQAALNSAASAAESEVSTNGEKVNVEVSSGVDINGNVETDTTNVKLEVPAGAPDMPLPQAPEDMIAKAKEMVEEARRIDGASSKATKRKAAEIVRDADDHVGPESSKKVKVMEEQLKKEKIKTRALLGLSATLAIGSIIPYVL